MAEALYRRYRPRAFADVVGQDHITTTLRNQIDSGRIGHAYLFVGSRGCGKTTCARLMARDLNMAGLGADGARRDAISDAINEGRHLDIIEFDAASHTGVDNIRDILDKVPFRPTELPYKVYVIDEVHMLSTSAFNALLKTLEEPPSHVVFILATTDPQKIPATVVSRCQRFNFKRVPIALIVKRLRQICDAEGIEAEELALTLIARQATGALRDAVSLLDQIASSSSMRITPDDVRETLGATDSATVRQLIESLIDREPAAGLDAVQRALDQGADARQIARQLVDTLRVLTQLRVNKQARAGNDLSEGERAAFGDLAGRASNALLLKGVRAFSAAINEMRSSTDAQLALEMALLECVLGADAVAQPAVAPARAAGATSSEPQAEAAKPSQPQRPATTPPVAVPPGGVPGLDNAQWKLVLAELRRAGKAGLVGLLNSSKPLGFEGLNLLIKPNHAFAYAQMNEPQKIGDIANAVSVVLGAKYGVQLISPAPNGASEAGEDDPVLKAARKLGGQVRQ